MIGIAGGSWQGSPPRISRRTSSTSKKLRSVVCMRSDSSCSKVYPWPIQFNASRRKLTHVRLGIKFIIYGGHDGLSELRDGE